MPNLPNLSGSNIQDTYQRVLHTDGTLIYNGTGSIMSILPVTASYAISASHEITYELSSSYAETASMASSNFNVQGNISASGNLIVNEITAEELLIGNDIEISNNSSIFVGTSNTSITANNDDYWKISANGVEGVRIASSGVTINEGGVPQSDFRVESNTDTHAFFIDAGADKVAIGTDTVSDSLLTVDGNITTAGEITASGNISASGNIVASNVMLPGAGKISFDNSLDGTDQFISGVDNQIAIDGDNFVKVFADKFVTFYNSSAEDHFTIQHESGSIVTDYNVTASGDISSSGDIYGQNIYAGSQVLVNGDVALSQDQFRISGERALVRLSAGHFGIGNASPGSSEEHLLIPGNVTASGNISASGDLYSGDKLYINSKEALEDTGTTLSINEQADFTGGVQINRSNLPQPITLFGSVTASGIISASAGIITPTLSGGAIGDPSGSLTLSGSLSFNDNIPTPEISASTLFVKTSIEANHDLRYSNIGLTPAFGYASLDDASTDTSDEILFGVGSAVTSVQHNMQVIHDTTTNGTRIYALYDGVYKVTGNYLFEGSTALTTIDIKVDGTTVHTQIPTVHGSVDPVNRTHIYVGSIDSGSYVTATADGTSLEYEIGSVLMVERLI